MPVIRVRRLTVHDTAKDGGGPSLLSELWRNWIRIMNGSYPIGIDQFRNTGLG